MKYELYINKIGVFSYEVSLYSHASNIWILSETMNLWKAIKLTKIPSLTPENCLVHIDKNSLLFRIFDLQNFETKHYKP